MIGSFDLSTRKCSLTLFYIYLSKRVNSWLLIFNLIGSQSNKLLAWYCIRVNKLLWLIIELTMQYLNSWDLAPFRVRILIASYLWSNGTLMKWPVSELFANSPQGWITFMEWWCYSRSDKLCLFKINKLNWGFYFPLFVYLQCLRRKTTNSKHNLQ